MNLKSLAFRFRSWIIALIYFAAFLAPWDAFFEQRRRILWLSAMGWLAQTNVVTLGASAVIITFTALLFCASGAFFRVWGSAYLDRDVVHAGEFHGEAILAAGPYRYLRNPLYLGNCLFALGICILLPPSGAVFFITALLLFHLLLISAEEDFLSQRWGEAYRSYCRRTPRLLPSLLPKTGEAAGKRRGHWAPALIQEVFPAGFAACFAVLAWRYDAQILDRCLLICFGLSLIARAMPPSAPRANRATP